MNASAHKPRRRAANVMLDATLLAEAKAAGINVSQACEKGLAAELKADREARWLVENKGELNKWNEWVAENGIPLDEYHLEIKSALDMLVSGI